MEPNANRNQFSSYFHHSQQQRQQQQQQSTTTSTASGGSHVVYPQYHAHLSKRKRGRPRKYGSPEQALTAKKAASATATSSSHSSFLDAGQGFTPHVITVAAGEDVGQNIMLFMQQSRREICILSASGSISNASLRQPATATSGGSITYEVPISVTNLEFGLVVSLYAYLILMGKS